MTNDKFSLLRTVLKTLGLSQEATDDIVDRIADFLSDKDEKTVNRLEYPYHVRDDFLSAAEHNFYMVLRTAVADAALICPKVALGDLFYVRSNDPSKYRTYTNKIDRKHVDFLLCDPKTARPLVGIELDDKSHQRSDRQARDAFVENVYKAANIPLVRVPVRHSYSPAELSSLLRLYINVSPAIAPAPAPAPAPVAKPEVQENISTTPKCPKCGADMILRTAKSGANQGERFWGCSNYPQCRGILKHVA